MKSNILILISTLFTSFLHSQTAKNTEILITSKIIKINTIDINNNTTKAQIITLLGEPSRIKKNILDIEQYLIYDSLGLSIELNKETKNVAAVIVNYNWDEDEKMAKMTFNGNLKVDNLTINDLINTKTIQKETSFKDIMCMGEALCMSKPGKGVALLIGYNKDKKITQIGFSCPQ